MDAQITRIAGLSIQLHLRPALVVLVREGRQWHVERATSSTADAVAAFENPGCPVVLDATMFWQNSTHMGRETDADRLRATGWVVRAPNHGSHETTVRNPPRTELQANLDEMMLSGRLRPAPLLGENLVEALRFAAWGAHEASETDLLPHQRALVEQLDSWLATDEPIAVVIGEGRSGKALAVEAWAKSTGLGVATVQPSYADSDEEVTKQGKYDVMIFLHAEHVPGRRVAEALHGGRVVLVGGPADAGDRGMDAAPHRDAPLRGWCGPRHRVQGAAPRGIAGDRAAAGGHRSGERAMIPIPGMPDLGRAAVEALIAKADAGDSREWAKLCTEALERDVLLYACAEARAHAAVAAYRPSGSWPDRYILEAVDNLPLSLHAVAVYAPALGFQLLEMNFAQMGLKLEQRQINILGVDQLHVVNPWRVRFDVSTDEPLLDFPEGPEPLPPDKFVLATASGLGLVEKRGYMRKAIFPVLERQKLLATVVNRQSREGQGATADEEKRLGELRLEVSELVLRDRDRDSQMLDKAMRRVAAVVRHVNADALAGVQAP